MTLCNACIRRRDKELTLSFITSSSKALFDLFRQDVMNEVCDNHIANYSDTSYAADKIGEKLQSTNAFTAPIRTFI